LQELRLGTLPPQATQYSNRFFIRTARGSRPSRKIKTQERTHEASSLVTGRRFPSICPRIGRCNLPEQKAQCLSSIMPLVPFSSFAEVTLAICMVLFELSAVAITVTDLP
jgi:hypothetical protein